MIKIVILRYGSPSYCAFSPYRKPFLYYFYKNI